MLFLQHRTSQFDAVKQQLAPNSIYVTLANAIVERLCVCVCHVVAMTCDYINTTRHYLDYLL